jgi:cytochrome P450
MHMLNADPPDHTRLRRLVSAAFTARRMEGLRDRVQEITDELLDAMALKETADVIDDFAFPLPFLVICELIGVPADDRETFRTWSNTIMAGVAASGPETVEAITAMTAYVKDLVELRRSEPDDALLSGLIEASDTEDRLTGDELTSLVFLLLIAGHETTVNLIGNAIYLLLDRPAEAAALRADESLLPRAIEEVLRYESPVKTATFRMSTEDVQVGDVTIPAGSLVLISLLSAHRDGATFPDPDEFRLDRDEAQHVAFGYGVHYCIGAPLARIEGQIAIGSLLRRFPAMSPAVPLAELGWRPGILLRGLDHLPVQL